MWQSVSHSHEPYITRTPHLLCLKEQIGSLRETPGPDARVQKHAHADLKQASVTSQDKLIYKRHRAAFTIRHVIHPPLQ